MSALTIPTYPVWPLGLIANVTPGTPVKITSLVDSGNIQDPAAQTIPPRATFQYNAQQIIFQGVKAGVAGHGTQNNAGNVYVTLNGANRDDPGGIVLTIPPGATVFLASAPAVKNVYCPWRYSVDADNAGDSALVTALAF